MQVAGIQKLTLLDFPGHTAATVFTPGCDLRCPFCQNRDLVIPGPGGFPSVPMQDLFSFLETRRGLLDGVCITGGEPLMQPGLEEFCLRLREMGFLVKLDTNGTFHDRLRHILEAGLVDLVAVDVKNRPERYAETVGIEGFDLTPVRATVSLLLEGTVDYEFRTTVVDGLHGEEDLIALAHWIEGAAAWHLQQFVDSDGVLAGEGAFGPWAPGRLQALLPTLREIVPTVGLRGV